MILWGLALWQKGEEGSKASYTSLMLKGEKAMEKQGEARGKGFQAEVRQIQSHVGVAAGVLGKQRTEGGSQLGRGK